MTLHLSIKYSCPECNAKYIPYNETIICPKCSYKEKKDIYLNLVEGICDSFVFNIKQTGRFDNCWATMDISDTIQSFFFDIFNFWAFRLMNDHKLKDRDIEFAKFLKKTVDKANLGEDDYMRDYLKELGKELYEEFFNIRKYKLKIENKKIILQE